MPAEEPGDIFLQHRGLVLDTLLADPAIAAPAAGADAPEPDSEPAAPPRSSGGPKASERILALLNGQPYDAEPATGVRTMPPIGVPPDGPAPPAPAPDPGPSLPATAAAILTRLRRPKVALPIGAAAVLLLILTLLVGGGEQQRGDALLVVTPSEQAPAAPTSTAAPGPAPIEVRSAQSKCPPGSTSPMDAFSGEQGRAWSCVRAYRVDGQVLVIDLGRTYAVDSIGIVPGFDSITPDGADQWPRHRTVSRVSYRFDDDAATVYTQQTLDQRTLVTTRIDPPLRASRIVLTVLESRGEPSLNTTAVSSIVVTGT